jgi:hypothetical protein
MRSSWHEGKVSFLSVYVAKRDARLFHKHALLLYSLEKFIIFFVAIILQLAFALSGGENCVLFCSQFTLKTKQKPVIVLVTVNFLYSISLLRPQNSE